MNMNKRDRISTQKTRQKISHKIADWLETRWVTPAYAGWLLLALAMFFFGAATNTMSGWLYVISGVSIALLTIAAILPLRSLRVLELRRRSIQPISAGDELKIEIEIINPTAKSKTLLQLQDMLPWVLDNPVTTAIEEIPPNQIYRWVYYQPTQRRGVYHWHEVEMRTGTPLGLFWCRRSRRVPASAIVYPKVLPLTTCPLIDRIGEQESSQLESDRLFQTATQGITRNLRPYRYGDPIRMVHWRSSARYGELRVRELEISTGGQEAAIALDTLGPWNFDDFEQAVIAAASLYFYATRNQMNVRLWTGATGLVHGNRRVLETLAATNSQEESHHELPNIPLIWLTQNPESIHALPRGSRWVFWPNLEQTPRSTILNPNFPGLEIQPERSLQLQLQSRIE
jgi:uncharacterized protein (DUF58 family)